MSRTSIRRVAVAWTVAMTAVGGVVGISLGTHTFSGGDSGDGQASVVSVAEEDPQAELREAQARIDAANQQALLAQQAAAEKARKKAAAAKAAKAKAKAEAAAKAKAEREKAAEEAAKRAEEAEERASRSEEDRTPIKVEPGSAKAIGREMAKARGWGDSQFRCLEQLWDKESRWRVDAENPSSGAYGIPQALPGSKMESAGSDWKTNPRTQIEWGLDYIKSRYSTPCGAWEHSQSKGWY